MQTLSMTLRSTASLSFQYIGTNKMERGKEAGEGNATDVWHGS